MMPRIKGNEKGVMISAGFFFTTDIENYVKMPVLEPCEATEI